MTKPNRVESRFLSTISPKRTRDITAAASTLSDAVCKRLTTAGPFACYPREDFLLIAKNKLAAPPSETPLD